MLNARHPLVKCHSDRDRRARFKQRLPCGKSRVTILQFPSERGKGVRINADQDPPAAAPRVGVRGSRRRLWRRADRATVGSLTTRGRATLAPADISAGHARASERTYRPTVRRCRRTFWRRALGHALTRARWAVSVGNSVPFIATLLAFAGVSFASYAHKAKIPGLLPPVLVVLFTLAVLSEGCYQAWRETALELDAANEALAVRDLKRKLGNLLEAGARLRRDIHVQRPADPAETHDRIERWIRETAAELDELVPDERAVFVADTGDYGLPRTAYLAGESHQMYRDIRNQQLARLDRHLERLRDITRRSTP